MPFYEALKYILSTAQGMVKRKDWDGDYYIKRKYNNGCNEIYLHTPDGDKLYYPKNIDLVSNDWCLVKE